MKKICYTILFLASSCSSDIKIDDNYSIYDLGGSNQTLINKDRTVQVSDITSFYATKNSILFETNGGGDSRLQNRGEIIKFCQYGIVNKLSGRIKIFSARSELQTKAKSILKESGKIILSRSCLN